MEQLQQQVNTNEILLIKLMLVVKQLDNKTKQLENYISKTREDISSLCNAICDVIKLHDEEILDIKNNICTINKRLELQLDYINVLNNYCKNIQQLDLYYYEGNHDMNLY